MEGRQRIVESERLDRGEERHGGSVVQPGMLVVVKNSPLRRVALSSMDLVVGSLWMPSLQG